jgi:hypothetical protein
MLLFCSYMHDIGFKWPIDGDIYFFLFTLPYFHLDECEITWKKCKIRHHIILDNHVLITKYIIEIECKHEPNKFGVEVDFIRVG